MALDALTMRESVAFGRAIMKAWWKDICSYVPQRYLKFVEGDPERVVINLSRDRLTISRGAETTEPGSTEMLSWQDRIGELESQLKGALGGDTARRSGVSVILDSDMVLVRRLNYPLLAEASLTRLFQGQLDALTPWSGEDAWVGWQVAERRLRARQIDVELYVAPKQRLENLVEAVRRAAGGDFSLSSEHGPLLQEIDRQPSDRRIRKILDASIFGLPVLLALLIIYLPLHLDQKYVKTLKSETEILRADVNKSIALGKSVSDLAQEFAALRKQRSENTPVVEILALLSSALGDDVWLDHFVVSGRKIELSGSALDAYAMVSSLQQMDEVKDVRLRSPIVKGKQEGHQRFQIELQMEGLK